MKLSWPIKNLLLILTVFFCSKNSIAQASTSFFKKSDSLNTSRRNAVYIAEGSLATLSLVVLNQVWYADYPRSPFHGINDNNDWLQMDKGGHVLSAYYVGKLGMNALDWAGERKKNQLLYGATLGFTFLTAVEILDGFSEEWGFSTGDMLANVSGTGLLIGQELLWEEQRFILKYSFHTTSYAALRPEVLGENFLQQSLKDYNGITYWLSANIWSFDKKGKFPKWLNVALGYGADGLISGNSADYTPANIDGGAQRRRQFYLSLDLDLSKIKTKSKFLQTIFSTINFIKIPAPALEIDSNGKSKFHFLYF